MPRKGQILSPAAIEQMKKSKIQKMLSKYHWEVAEEFKDVVIDNGSRNRSKKFITISEFKDFLENGETLKSIKKQGISKHLIQFFSNLLQGKIQISKKKFIEEYNSGLSLDEIGERHNITRDDMMFLRQLYGQKPKGAKFIHRKNTEVPLTQRQIEILYGSMMGDAAKTSPSSAKFKQGIEQKDYLLWKYKEFESVASKNSLQQISGYDKRYDKYHMSWRFYTHANTDVERILEEFYKTGTKQITKELLENLTPLSIAVWYMDDGETDFHFKKIKDTEHKVSSTFMFCTDSFSRESCEDIQIWFGQNYGINTRLVQRELSDGMGYRVAIENESREEFLNIITPYILPMFSYKIDYKIYLDKVNADDHFKVLDDAKDCPLGDQFSNLSLKEQDVYVNKFVSYYHSKSFYRILPVAKNFKKDIFRVFGYDTSKLMHDDGIGFSPVGNKYILSHFPRFWSAKLKARLSPKDIFDNDKYLAEIVREVILDGKFPTSSKILSKLKKYRGNKTISNFSPVVAKSVYDKYCDENSKVLDFCGGYGGRLFGAAASDKVVSYSCIEIDFDSFSGLQDLYRSLRINGELKKEINIFNQDSVLGMKMFSDKAFDFCFTSPPYYDAEEYADDKNQSIQKYENYADWFDKFLVRSIREAMRVSKVVAINIANTGSYKIADDFEEWLKKEEIPYQKDYLRYPKYGGKYKLDPLFVIK